MKIHVHTIPSKLKVVIKLMVWLNSVNCYLVQASEQEKHLFYSAGGQLYHMMLRSEGAEMYQLVTQPGKYLSLFLQPKPPWQILLTQPHKHVEEKGVHLHREVMTLNSETTVAAPESYECRLSGGCFLRTLYQDEWYSSCNMLQCEAQPPDDNCVVLIDHCSRLVFGILRVLLTWSTYFSLSDCKCDAHWKQGFGEFSQVNHCENLAPEPLSQLELDGGAFILCFLQGQGLARYRCSTCAINPIMQISFEAWCTCVLPMCTDMRMEEPKGNGELTQWWLASNLFVGCLQNNNCGSDISRINILQEAITLIFWMPVDLDGEDNQHKKTPWDPGGSMRALCSCEKWTTLVPSPLSCSDQLWWLSLRFAYASWILLIAWTANGMQFYGGYWQAHFQEGRNVMNQAAVSEQVHVGHDYYIAFVNEIFVGYNYYLDQVSYLDIVCSNLVYYRKAYPDDPDKIMEVQAPWDPGKSALRYPLKISAWGQAEFQEGRNVMTLACGPHVGPLLRVLDEGLGPTIPARSTYTHQATTISPSSWITDETAALSPPMYSSLSLPRALSLIPDSPSLLLLVSPN